MSTLMYTMAFELRCVNTDSSVITNAPLGRDVDNWEEGNYACVGQEVYRKSLYPPPNHAVNIKIALKYSLLTNIYYWNILHFYKLSEIRTLLPLQHISVWVSYISSDQHTLTTNSQNGLCSSRECDTRISNTSPRGWLQTKFMTLKLGCTPESLAEPAKTQSPNPTSRGSGSNGCRWSPSLHFRHVPRRYQCTSPGSTL